MLHRQAWDEGLCRYVKEEAVERWTDDAQGPEVADVAAEDQGVQPAPPANESPDGAGL
jgi:hypothetical protein